MLEVKNLHVYYESALALHDISIKVNEGELVSVVGSNGAGKSTLLKTIVGLVKPRSGEIRLRDERIDALNTPEIISKGISLIPEGRRLFPNMTVLENLEMGAYTKEAWEKRRETLDWIFDLFPILKERQKQLAGTLSGGEQQMLAIGRGLMSRPRLLMFDEPSLGLAPKLVAKVFETVKDLNDQGLTILLVEQNVLHSLRLCDRGYVLENGRITLSGRGDELLENAHVREAYLGI
ncbi:MAG: ABC transporter ATP-binding protein [Candidatus Bathyarchaeia archaeon]